MSALTDIRREALAHAVHTAPKGAGSDNIRKRAASYEDYLKHGAPNERVRALDARDADIRDYEREAKERLNESLTRLHEAEQALEARAREVANREAELGRNTERLAHRRAELARDEQLHRERSKMMLSATYGKLPASGSYVAGPLGAAAGAHLHIGTPIEEPVYTDTDSIECEHGFIVINTLPATRRKSHSEIISVTCENCKKRFSYVHKTN